MKKYIIIGALIIGLFVSTQIAGIHVVSAQSYTFNNDLIVGSRGPDVVQLQNWLIANGYSIPAISSGAVPAGYFGVQTRSALIVYQRSVGFPAFGFFGPMTRGRINGILGGGDFRGGSLTVTLPNGGETWQKGTIRNITWTGVQGVLAQSGDIWLTPHIPACAEPSAPVQCYVAIQAPFLIARGVDLRTQSYPWNVGVVSFGSGNQSVIPLSDGQYKVKICPTSSPVPLNYPIPTSCDSSNDYFNITSAVSPTNQPPVITGITAPTVLTVGQVGTWTVNAYDPANLPLTYSIHWGDETMYAYPVNAAMTSSDIFTQGTTFTHSYSLAGTYTVIVTVRDSYGSSVQSTATVQVGAGTSAGPLNIISPNGGESWQLGTMHTISWTAPYYFRATYANINLVPYYQPCTSYICPMNAQTSLYPYRIPYTIATNVSLGGSGIYNWRVGDTINSTAIVPAGSYSVQICEVSSSACDSSAAPFTVY